VLRQFRADGTPLRQVRITDAQVPLTPADAKRRFDLLLQITPGSAAPKKIATMQKLPVPHFLPVIRSFVVSSDGSLAIVRGDRGWFRDRSSDSVQVDLFRPSGIRAGTVMIRKGDDVVALEGKSLFIVHPVPSSEGQTANERGLPAVRVLSLSMRF
jgi:hypothetical protein